MPGRRHLTYASRHGHAPIDRALYLDAEWAADEERRLLTGVPDDVVFATKPQLAAALLARTRDLGIRARWLAADEVYGGKELGRMARALGFDYALAVRTDHHVDTAVGRMTVTQLAARVPKKTGCACAPATASRAPPLRLGHARHPPR